MLKFICLSELKIFHLIFEFFLDWEGDQLDILADESSEETTDSEE